MADSSALLQARFGIDLPGADVPDAIAALLDRRVTRRYRDQDIPDPLLDTLLAAAQSAPMVSGPPAILGRGDARPRPHQADRRLDRHHGLDRHRPGLPGLVRRHAPRPAPVRAPQQTPRQQQPRHLPQHRGRLRPGDGTVHRRRRRRRPRHLPDQLRAQPHRARHPPARPAPRRLPRRRPHRRLAGLPPPDRDAPPSLRRRPPRALRRHRPGNPNPGLRHPPRRPRTDCRRQSEEQRHLPTPRRRRLERERRAPALGARAFRFLDVPENPRLRHLPDNCRRTADDPLQPPSAPATPPDLLDAAQRRRRLRRPRLAADGHARGKTLASCANRPGLFPAAPSITAPT